MSVEEKHRITHLLSGRNFITFPQSFISYGQGCHNLPDSNTHLPANIYYQFVLLDMITDTKSKLQLKEDHLTLYIINKLKTLILLIQ